MSDTPKVYAAIAAVSAELAKTGVSKNKRNTQQGYNFRGIDDVYNALAPVLASKGLVILPRILSRNVTERQTAKGGVLFYVVVEAEFDFVSTDDGSKHVARTYGEAMDSADKATNKAMSAAYKYVTFQAFCIPTEGDNDADATTHQIRPADEPVDNAPEGYGAWYAALEAKTQEGTKTLSPFWATSDLGYRRYLTTQTPNRWEALKAAAAKVREPAHA